MSPAAWALATPSAYDTPAQIFAEHAALSAFENDGARDFDIGAFAKIGETDYPSLGLHSPLAREKRWRWADAGSARHDGDQLN